MAHVRKPRYTLWIQGKPLSPGAKRQHLAQYKQTIRETVLEEVEQPVSSTRIEVAVFFTASGSERPDVDNVLKPILDALKGVLYEDDRQVWSVRCTALPDGEAYGLDGWIDGNIAARLGAKDEFLINIYGGFSTPGP